MIKAIFIAAEPGEQQQAVQQISVQKQKGIIGDRNFDQHRWHGQNITLIESENIAAFNQRYQQNISLDATRRNLITKGIDLNQLIGQEFTIGSIKLIGTELCEPCHSLCQNIANHKVSKQQVLEALTNQAGIRANILNSGHIHVGMSISIV